eukprot:gene9586-biopygen9209
MPIVLPRLSPRRVPQRRILQLMTAMRLERLFALAAKKEDAEIRSVPEYALFVNH